MLLRNGVEDHKVVGMVRTIRRALGGSGCSGRRGPDAHKVRPLPIVTECAACG